jgi:hypothetical protein
MKVTIDIASGNNNSMPTKRDLDHSIQSIQKAIDRQPLSGYDTDLLLGIKSILIGIQEQLPEKE